MLNFRNNILFLLLFFQTWENKATILAIFLYGDDNTEMNSLKGLKSTKIKIAVFLERFGEEEVGYYHDASIYLVIFLVSNNSNEC